MDRITQLRSRWSEGGPYLIAARSLSRMSHALAVRGAARKVRSVGPGSLDAALEVAERFRFGDVTIAPLQVRSEILDFLHLLEEKPPEAVLEIGTARGGTLFLFSRVARPDAVLVTIDFPGGEGSFGGNPAHARRGRLYRSMRRERQRVEFIAADSHLPATRERVVELLDGRALDLLFIDGDHTYEGICADYELYAPLVRRDGLIAFHDIVPGPSERVGGAPTFWCEVRDSTALEFVEDWKQGGYGIGVLKPCAEAALPRA
jgi:predicted O-methyltransferase YrrM